jgi:hypothetical protein
MYSLELWNKIPLETAGFFIAAFARFQKYDYFCSR